ncbi:unnamed protein product [Adineta ricciae]|uniref:NAD(P)(+)--arginine ADP-ribosyltransferase n=1 Tax=Adineta ricciae TaxID=249248 RepID=A0A815HZX6_ADIRI|nr:unnamed protein product [Adineta ricciae]
MSELTKTLGDFARNLGNPKPNTSNYVPFCVIISKPLYELLNSRQFYAKDVAISVENDINTNGDSGVRNNRLVAGVAGVKDEAEPVIGYAQEPLLSLAEACAPLVDLFHNMSFYVQMAVEETPEEPPDGLTVDESAAIRLYTIEWEKPHYSLYSTLNHTLKTAPRDDLRPYFKYLKLFLTALVKLPCVPPVTVWRGVTKDLSAEFPRGTLMTWWAFSSCTTELTVLENNMYLGTSGERTLFSIEVFNGRTVRAHSHFVTEDEIILLPGTHMEVQSLFRPAPDLNIVHLKQIKPVETLLELPFPGAMLYPPEKKKLPWYKKKRTMVELGLLIVACIAGIIVGAVLGSRRSPPPPICRPRPSIVRSDYFWSFDCSDAREDLTGLYNGTAINGVDFVHGDFSGQADVLQLNRLLYQYVSLPRSLNLTLNTSFTMSAWILLGGYRSKNILTDCSYLNPVCIAFNIEDTTMNIRIFNWTNANILQEVYAAIQNYVCQACWMYISFSFNHQTGSTVLYLNGVRLEEKFLNLTYPILARANQTELSYIGLNAVTRANYFYGLIDQLSILYAVKSDSEIKYEATIIFFYLFDSDQINVDAGPNNILANSASVYRAVSNNQSTLLFNTTDSYFQSLGFTLLDSNDYEFSIVFWLRLIIPKPATDNSAIAVLQLSSMISGLSSGTYSCAFCLHVNPNNGSTGYFFPRTFTTIYPNGSSVLNNTWVHIGVVYVSPETYYFYQNGKLLDMATNRRFSSIISSNSRFSVSIGGIYLDSSMPVKPTNYEQMKCFSGIPVFNYTKMYGQIDDFALHARSLTAEEFAGLADPKNKFGAV